MTTRPSPNAQHDAADAGVEAAMVKAMVEQFDGFIATLQSLRGRLERLGSDLEGVL